jgi:hypothetical protein
VGDAREQASKTEQEQGEQKACSKSKNATNKGQIASEKRKRKSDRSATAQGDLTAH